MLTNKRHDAILKILETKGSVTLQELKDTLNTSESTIRRDLTQLHEDGKLVKVFGGALAQENLNQNDELVGSRQIQNVTEKQLVARYAATLIHDQDFVFIDAGTTTECLLPYLTNTTATYVTNAPGHAQKMCQAGLHVLLIGGALKHSTEAAIGAQTCAQLEAYHFNIAFMGTNGISLHAHLSTPDPEEAMVKRLVIHHTLNSYVICDHSKFHRISPATFANLEDVIVLVDSVPEGPYREISTIIDVSNQEER